MDRLDWEFEDLAEATGIEWCDLIHHRADASNMGMSTLVVVADALGVSPADLTKSHETEARR